MRIDIIRFRQYVSEITKNSQDLKKTVEQGALAPDSMELKAAKYILIELAEALTPPSLLSILLPYLPLRPSILVCRSFSWV